MLRIKGFFVHFGTHLHLNSLTKYCFVEKKNTKTACKHCSKGKAQATGYSRKT